MNGRTRYLIACATTGIALGISWAAFMAITATIEGAKPPASAYWRLATLVATIGFLGQLALGRPLISTLTARGMFNLPTVTAVYLAPVLLIGFLLADTTADLTGIVPWACFAIVSAGVFFMMVRPLTK